MGKYEPSQLLRFFHYEHLPAALQEVSKPFCDLAKMIDQRLGDNAERTVCLRRLLEAKDSAVRSKILAGGLDAPRPEIINGD